MRLVEALVAVTIAATLVPIAADPVLDLGNKMIDAANALGRGERERQVPVRALSCEAFPDDCPPPVEPWTDAPHIAP